MTAEYEEDEEQFFLIPLNKYIEVIDPISTIILSTGCFAIGIRQETTSGVVSVVGHQFLMKAYDFDTNDPYFHRLNRGVKFPVLFSAFFRCEEFIATLNHHDPRIGGLKGDLVTYPLISAEKELSDAMLAMLSRRYTVRAA